MQQIRAHVTSALTCTRPEYSWYESPVIFHAPQAAQQSPRRTLEMELKHSLYHSFCENRLGATKITYCKGVLFDLVSAGVVQELNSNTE